MLGGEVDEPEPAPQAKVQYGRAEAVLRLLHEQITREFAAFFQQYQLTADVACGHHANGSDAAFFHRISEETRLQLGQLVDMLLDRGGRLHLPQLPAPCSHLIEEGAQGSDRMSAALGACLQIEESKARDRFRTCARSLGDVDLEARADALALHAFQTRSLLLRSIKRSNFMGELRDCASQPQSQRQAPDAA